MDEFKLNCKLVTDYFITAHPTANEFYGQINLGGPDHRYWAPAEVIELLTGPNRQSFKIDLNCKGADLATETATAMTSSAVTFQTLTPTYSSELLIHTRKLYNLALASTGTDGKENGYVNCITNAQTFYNSNFGLYWDEMAWGAHWLYCAITLSSGIDHIAAFIGTHGLIKKSKRSSLTN